MVEYSYSFKTLRATQCLYLSNLIIFKTVQILHNLYAAVFGVLEKKCDDELFYLQLECVSQKQRSLKINMSLAKLYQRQGMERYYCLKQSTFSRIIISSLLCHSIVGLYLLMYKVLFQIVVQVSSCTTEITFHVCLPPSGADTGF